MGNTVAVESSFSWLDHREKDAQRAREILKALDEGTTVDSIGIGTVRDAIADLLFPAISTLHTRARYFLFVPWIYQRLEAERISSAKAAEAGREREIALTYALLRGCPEGEQGIIGRDAREGLKQLPRIVYWNGTAALGIRLFPGSIRQYFQSLDGFYRRTRQELTTGDDPEAASRGVPNWDFSLPEPPTGWERECTLDLTADESTYLIDRAQTSLPGTLLAELLGRRAPVEAQFPWEVDDQTQLPATVRGHLEHARWFSSTIHGAQLLYNLMVAEAIERDTGRPAEPTEYYREELRHWARAADNAADERSHWDRHDFWQTVDAVNRRVPGRARDFINDWFDAVDSGADDLANDTHWRDRIRQREHQLKGGLARLANPRARETWGGATGARQLDFRWSEASTAVNDIANGLLPRVVGAE